ncbi:M20/M25/M40 family metallo-hydrolase [Terrilactibacillus sp. BCM23-1]|uniref:M20/M25/M40 family metallo-hydrolase n=1 Tax=Terrilactibacillus tamarindi TaxID=2599694 RepID=A0A6N8CU75_9BACI|nr:M42 family metallopeptidase [Terrilactibacillus tamarindi]MTT32585.1 M20/M25/M40 family metallo-hydrolase [Terrilactibacillus tamarindi]
MTYPDVKATMKLLKDLVSIPSPTGNTGKIITFVENLLHTYGYETERNNKGGLLITIPGENQSQHRFLTAHVDTLGAMVKKIKSNGRLKLSMIGGFKWNAVEGEYCTIETSSGKTYTGTILMHQQSVHVYKDAGDAERSNENIEVRIDEKVTNEEDVRSLGIEVGDFVSFDPRPVITESGFIKSRHLDDKASVAILIRLLKHLKEDNITLPYTTHILISNNEEIGYGGNSNIPPETVEYVAVDMGALGDGQASDEYTVSICAKDSSGPYHYGLRKHFVELAKENDIDYKVDIYPYYGSDASAAISAGNDIIHGLIGAGIESSHAFERTHESSILNTEKLVYVYVLSKMVI